MAIEPSRKRSVGESIAWTKHTRKHGRRKGNLASKTLRTKDAGVVCSTGAGSRDEFDGK